MSLADQAGAMRGPRAWCDRIDDGVSVIVVPERVLEIEFGTAFHAEALHQAPAANILFNRNGDGFIGAKPLKRRIERRDRGFLGVAFAPGRFAQPPSGFHHALSLIHI